MWTVHSDLCGFFQTFCMARDDIYSGFTWAIRVLKSVSVFWVLPSTDQQQWTHYSVPNAVCVSPSHTFFTTDWALNCVWTQFPLCEIAENAIWISGQCCIHYATKLFTFEHGGQTRGDKSNQINMMEYLSQGLLRRLIIFAHHLNVAHKRKNKSI